VARLHRASAAASKRGGAERDRARRQAVSSQSKQHGLKWLGFAFCYFSESGLFNALPPIQIKKSGPVSRNVQTVSDVFSSPSLLTLLAAPPAGSTSSPRMETYSTDFCFIKAFVAGFRNPKAARKASATMEGPRSSRAPCENAREIKGLQGAERKRGIGGALQVSNGHKRTESPRGPQADKRRGCEPPEG
jgi:hypothetical protein